MSQKAPRVDGPRDVPRLRAHLLSQWRTGQMRYPITEVARNTDTGEVFERQVLGGGEWDQACLRHPSYWYVARTMCDVLAVAETQLPTDTVLEPELVPAESGLVVFEEPMMSVDSDTGERTMNVDAIVWGSGMMPPTPGWVEHPVRALGISSYRRMRLDAGLRAEELHAMAASGAVNAVVAKMYAAGKRANAADWDRLVGEVWVPLGRSDWVFGESLLHRHGPASEAALLSHREDRQRMAAMWLLTSQEGIADTVADHGSRQERRRAERAGEPEPTVRVVNVKTGRAEGSERTEHDERRHLTVRFLVSGHWRRQYYRSDGSRRPIWIHPHWRGPEDGPISDVTKVKVWK